MALVIGDVMGHGLSEAATIGRLRTAVRTLADLELPPGEVLFHLNDLVSGLGNGFYATCLYIAYDPTRHLCSIARAGHPPPAVDIAAWSLPEDPRAAGQARAHVRGQLGLWHLDALTMTTELLVSELVGNVVRHAEGPIGLRLLRSRVMISEVPDGSPATPRIRRAGDLDAGGRGLQLVAAVAHRWGARYTAQGKCIWAEQLLT